MGNEGKYDLYEVYKIYDKGPPQLNEVGSWFADTKVFEFSEVDKNIRRRNLRVKIA